MPDKCFYGVAGCCGMMDEFNSFETAPGRICHHCVVMMAAGGMY